MGEIYLNAIFFSFFSQHFSLSSLRFRQSKNVSRSCSLHGFFDEWKSGIANFNLKLIKLKGEQYS